jgi:magnesium-transporting ATPase (P-type)
MSRKKTKLGEKKMDKKFTNVLIFMVVVLALFGFIMFVLGGREPSGALNFSVDQATVVIRFVFVVIGLLIAFAVYFFTKENKAWEVGTREVCGVLMVIQWHGLCRAFVEPGFTSSRHRDPDVLRLRLWSCRWFL